MWIGQSIRQSSRACVAGDHQTETPASSDDPLNSPQKTGVVPSDTQRAYKRGCRSERGVTSQVVLGECCGAEFDNNKKVNPGRSKNRTKEQRVDEAANTRQSKAQWENVPKLQEQP